MDLSSAPIEERSMASSFNKIQGDGVIEADRGAGNGEGAAKAMYNI